MMFQMESLIRPIFYGDLVYKLRKEGGERQ